VPLRLVAVVQMSQGSATEPPVPVNVTAQQLLSTLPILVDAPLISSSTLAWVCRLLGSFESVDAPRCCDGVMSPPCRHRVLQ
jgi:hypothetical protein